ncbi:MAG TPA: putative ABC transporter permease [Spirochaetota bacterium]|nr:putative ABC transporter permease [Spirochaetota bacterium]
MYLSAERLFLLFYVFSFSGWIIESVYRSLNRKRFVNPGFLFGPHLPLYGTGAIILILLYPAIRELHPALRGLSYMVALTLVEYVAGLLLLHAFNRRCWDYRDDPLNHQGLICPGFSLCWVILAFVFEKTLYPLALRLAQSIDQSILPGLNALFLTVMAIDFFFASGLAGRARLYAGRLPNFTPRLALPRYLPAAATCVGRANSRIASWMAERYLEYAPPKHAVRSRALKARAALVEKIRLDSIRLRQTMIGLSGGRLVPEIMGLIKRLK